MGTAEMKQSKDDGLAGVLRTVASLPSKDGIGSFCRALKIKRRVDAR